MFKGKYTSIFSPQMEAIVFIIVFISFLKFLFFVLFYIMQMRKVLTS